MVCILYKKILVSPVYYDQMLIKKYFFVSLLVPVSNFGLAKFDCSRVQPDMLSPEVLVFFPHYEDFFFHLSTLLQVQYCTNAILLH